MNKIVTKLRNDRGGVSPFILVFLPALVGFAGLTYDAGTLFEARREANNVAAAAARAGANTVIIDSLYLGVPELDPGGAIGNATAFATAQGVTVTGTELPNLYSIKIDISQTHQPLFLGIFGVGELTVNGTSTARVRSAVNADDSL